MKDKICLVDVGARGGIDPRWKPHHHQISVIAFEPDETEVAALRLKTYDYPIKFLPVALGAHNNQAATLRLTRQPGCSSTLQPNLALCRKYEFGPNMEVISELPVVLHRMDSVLNEQPDVMKIDTQGTELHILQGAGDLLDACLAVEAEVEFDHQYIGQPLFADVDAFMRSKGFNLHALRRTFWRLKGQHGSARGGKLMHGDVLYFRDGIGETEKGRIILAAYQQHDMLARYGGERLIPRPSRWRQLLGGLQGNKELRRLVDSLRPVTASDWHDPDFF